MMTWGMMLSWAVPFSQVPLDMGSLATWQTGKLARYRYTIPIKGPSWPMGLLDEDLRSEVGTTGGLHPGPGGMLARAWRVPAHCCG